MHQPPPEPPGRIPRWRVTEPVRFYLWPAVLAVAGLLTYLAWHRPTVWAPALVVVVMLALSVEAVRVSTVTPAELVRSRQKQ